MFAGKKECYSPAAHRRHAVFSGKLQKKNTWLVKTFIKTKTRIRNICLFLGKTEEFQLEVKYFLINSTGAVR